MRGWTVLGFAGLGLASAAIAQSPAGTGLTTALETCRAEMSDAKRLRCYDQALDTALGVDEKIVAKREEFKRQRFGLPVDDNGMRMLELEATIRSVDVNMRKDITVIELDNGQMWQLTASGGLRNGFEPGAKVIVTDSGVSGYRIRIPDKTGFRGIIRVR